MWSDPTLCEDKNTRMGKRCEASQAGWCVCRRWTVCVHNLPLVGSVVSHKSQVTVEFLLPFKANYGGKTGPDFSVRLVKHMEPEGVWEKHVR